MDFTTFQKNMFRMAACLHRSGIHPVLQKWATTYTALPAKDQRFLYDTLAASDGSDREVVEKMFSSFGVGLKFPFLGILLRKGCFHKVEYETPKDREKVCKAFAKALSGKRYNEHDHPGYKGYNFVDMVFPIGEDAVGITRKNPCSGVIATYANERHDGLLLDADTYLVLDPGPHLSL